MGNVPEQDHALQPDPIRLDIVYVVLYVTPVSGSVVEPPVPGGGAVQLK